MVGNPNATSDKGNVVWPLRKPLAMAAGASRTAAAAPDALPDCTAWTNVVALDPNACSALIGPPSASIAKTSGSPAVVFISNPKRGLKTKLTVDVRFRSVTVLTTLAKFCDP